MNKTTDFLEIKPSDAHYPSILKDRKWKKMPILYCNGNVELLNKKSFAVIGSRDVSSKGIENAKTIVAYLVRKGYNIISGYARGVDSCAHFEALKNKGTTTIVLSSGLCHFSKKEMLKNLKWNNNFLVVSQFSPQAKWTAYNAMIRNSLICALSKGVIIIESGVERDSSGKMSGTFQAGKICMKMGVPLFVLSPSLFENKATGNKELIELGAIEISNAKQILDFFEQNKEKDVINQDKQLELNIL